MKEPAREGLANWIRQGDRQSQLMLLRHFIDRMPVLQNWPERAEGLPIGLVDDQPVYLPLEGHSLTITVMSCGRVRAGRRCGRARSFAPQAHRSKCRRYH